ncbi:sugar ABC transporter permease [Pseudorhodobacter sp.]|uniref:sugar ABC transporter permease n=1 Tax=Pseudorhodobacter sp. TaxID=1934400 RepID=UPI002649C66F|nr:sugar ABC transporter permease [Pseudorhodobacter sp.]MDN5786162.1 sugar ABC transporter permease [Pseudorhodobacter sp.]
MTDTTRPTADATEAQPSLLSRFLRDTEIDTRLLGMAGALVLIWVGFHFYGAIFKGFGAFLTPRNLWNLSVQTSSIGIMATGMVLVIISRNIDLSVGSLLGVCAVMMGMVQVYWLPQLVGLGNPMIWVITGIIGMVMGAFIGAFQGWLIAYREIPSFIVTLGGLLVWRGCAFLMNRGETISPLDENFTLIGGGPYGAIGATGSWIVGLLGCAFILWGLWNGRKQRIAFHFPLRPVWAEMFLAVLGCGLVIGAVLLVNSYEWPIGIVRQYAAAKGLTTDPANLHISYGFAIPVLILVVVAILMNILMTRTRFGRYVFAIGGNPEAAALSGIKTKWMTVKIFALMGFLTGLSAIVASARLNSATNALGELDELFVIAAAVIGGTSLAGGIGTIFGAILGALVMQSLQTGMVLIGVDAAMQKVVVGAVLVLAVWLDILYRRKTK